MAIPATALGPLISTGGAFLGQLFNDDDEEKKKDREAQERMNKERIAAEQQMQGQKLMQEQGQFSANLGNQKYEFGRSAAFKGLDYLGSQMQNASAMARTRNFKNAVFDAARSTAGRAV